MIFSDPRTMIASAFPSDLDFAADPAITAQLEDKLGLDAAAAGNLFDDVQRFMRLSARFPDVGLAPPPAIDKGWHQFILNTGKYAEFCYANFGKFVHHKPYTRKQRAERIGVPAARRTIELAQAEYGTLSANWQVNLNLDCESCSGSTNCQDADCSPNE